MKLWHHKTVAEAMVDSKPKESPPPPPSVPTTQGRGMNAASPMNMPYPLSGPMPALGQVQKATTTLIASIQQKASGFHAQTGAINTTHPFTLELYDEHNNLIKSVPLLELIEAFENLEDMKAQLNRMEELYQEVLMATVEQTLP